MVAFLFALDGVRRFLSVSHPVPGWAIALAFVALAALGNRAFPNWISHVKAAPAYLWGRLCAIPLSALPGTALFGEVLIFFRGPLFSSTVKIPFDLEGYHLPIASFIAKSLRNGEFPLWDPYSYCGVPIYANLQAQLFYPPAWPVFLLGSLNRVVHNVFRLLEWQVAIHVFLGGAFTYLLLRRLRLSRGSALFGASIFQLGGFFASQAQHLGAICGAAWLPLAWLAVVMLRDRFEWRSLALLAVAFALSFLAGFPAITAVVFGSSFLLAVALILVRRAPLKLLASIVMASVWALLLSAVLLLPSMELARLSLAALRGAWANGAGVPLQALVSMVAPNYYHIFDPAKYLQPWHITFMYLYCGIPGLVLSVFAIFRSRHKERTAFALLTLLCTLWMLGNSTPVGRAMFPLVPQFIRGGLYLEFAMAAFVLGISVLAAFGAEQVVAPRNRWFSVALVVLAVVDLTVAGSNRYMNTGDSPGITYEHFEGSRLAMSEMRRLVNETKVPSRIDVFDGSQAWAGRAPNLEVPTATGDDPLALLRVLKLRLCFAEGDYWERYYKVSAPESPLVNLLNVRFLLATAEIPVRSTQFARREILSFGEVYENSKVLPRFFLVNEMRGSRNLDDSIAAMRSADFDPARTAIVEGSSGLRTFGTATGKVSVVHYGNQDLMLETDSTGPAFLVTSETYYPGWRCKVDGHAQELLLTNAAFRGLPVPAGHHRITMEFSPRIVWYGGAISLCAWLFLLVCLRPAKSSADLRPDL